MYLQHDFLFTIVFLRFTNMATVFFSTLNIIELTYGDGYKSSSLIATAVWYTNV